MLYRFNYKKIKIVIEESLKLRNFTIKDFECHLEKSNAIDNVWPGNKELINWVIDVIKDIFSQAIEIEDNRVSINATTLYNQYELFEKAALSYRKENLKEEARDIQLSDMYHYLKKGDKVYKQIAFLSENIIPLEVAKNNPKTYEEALINLVKANLYQKNMQVIILQRERGEESYYKNDHEYTGIIVVDKGAIQVAYYVCQTAHCGRSKPHFDFGENASPIVPNRHLPQTLRRLTADCRSLV